MIPKISSLIPVSIIPLIFGAIAMPSPSYAQVETKPNPEDLPKEEKRDRVTPPSPRSYIGIGGNLGLSGDSSSLGTGGFAILSKQVLNDFLAIHGNNVVFGSATASQSIALTLNFGIRDETTKEILISPFLGAGARIRNDGATYIDPMAVGGIDVPLGKTFTGTVRLEAGFPSSGKADVGLSLGIGYNF